jgi:hypothetical protein
VRARAIAAALTLAACAPLAVDPDGPAAPPPTARSGSIVLAPDERSLWVASPDDDAVVQIRTDDLAEVRRVPVAGSPTQLAWAGDRLVVTLAQSSDVAIVGPGAAVRRVPTPCGGTRAVVVAAQAFVSCPDDDLVVELDPARGRVLRSVEAPGRPTALALAGDALFASAARTGHVRTYSVARIERAPPATWPTPVPLARAQLEDVALPADAGHAAVQVDALAVDRDGRLLGAYQRVEHDGDRDRPPSEGSYGSVVDGHPRIEPRLFGPCGERYAVFDGGARVFSGPSAIAAADDVVWVANRSTDSVAALRCSADDALAPLVASWRTGRGPSGIALSSDGHTAWVDLAYDHGIARLTLDDAPDAERRRDLGPTRLSADALRGRNLFDDAVDTHLTPSGIVTCATCHPGGGEDGLSWFLHTADIPPKLRRSSPAWGGRPALAPYHWDGGLPDAADLAEVNIVDLLGGDGLLVDTAAIAAWLAERPLPVPRPLAPSEQARARHGARVFEAAGCGACHAGPLFADGRAHDVLAPSADPDGALAEVDTPTLRGVRARPPYLHDGRAPTLRDVLTTHNRGDRHGRTSRLSSTDLDDLVLYLQTL